MSRVGTLELAMDRLGYHIELTSTIRSAHNNGDTARLVSNPSMRFTNKYLKAGCEVKVRLKQFEDWAPLPRDHDLAKPSIKTNRVHSTKAKSSRCYSYSKESVDALHHTVTIV